MQHKCGVTHIEISEKLQPLWRYNCKGCPQIPVTLLVGLWRVGQCSSRRHAPPYSPLQAHPNPDSDPEVCFDLKSHVTDDLFSDDSMDPLVVELVRAPAELITAALALVPHDEQEKLLQGELELELEPKINPNPNLISNPGLTVNLQGKLVDEP